MKKRNKILCFCGHTKAMHKGIEDIFGGWWETACSAYLPDRSCCICWDYKGDNLGYLEKLSVKS